MLLSCIGGKVVWFCCFLETEGVVQLLIFEGFKHGLITDFYHLSAALFIILVLTNDKTLF